MVIRRIRGKDFGHLFRLINEGFRKENEITGFDTGRLLRAAHFYSLFSLFFPLLDVLRVRYPNILVAASDGIIIGAINLVPRRKHVWSIDSVTVNAAFRGHGVYKRLMMEALKLVSQRGGKKVVQSVWTDNVAPVKVSKQLKFEVSEERLMLAAEFNEAPSMNANKDIQVRKFKSVDKKKVYKICDSETPRALDQCDDEPEDFNISFSKYISDKLTGSHSRKWVMEAQGKIIGYTRINYTSSVETASIEYFCVIPSDDSLEREMTLVRHILAFLRTKNIGKVMVSLSVQRRKTIETFKKTGFKPFASSYEMVKDIV